MSGLLGLFGNKDKEEKAQQEEVGNAMKNLSDQIGNLQQQGLGKDKEISRLREELSELQSKAGSASADVKKQMQDLSGKLAAAEADKQAHDIIMQGKQNEIDDLKKQLQEAKDAAASAVAGAAKMGATETGLAVGANAWVRRAGGMSLRRRSGPSLNASVQDGLAPGTQLSILEGPTSADGHTWWRIRTEDGREGWVAGEELVNKPD